MPLVIGEIETPQDIGDIDRGKVIVPLVSQSGNFVGNIVCSFYSFGEDVPNRRLSAVSTYAGGESLSQMPIFEFCESANAGDAMRTYLFFITGHDEKSGKTCFGLKHGFERFVERNAAAIQVAITAHDEEIAIKEKPVRQEATQTNTSGFGKLLRKLGLAYH